MGDELSLFELAPRLLRLQNETLRDVGPGLTFRQYRTLLRVHEGLVTVTEIGHHATLSLPAISESVVGLVRKGLLERGVSTQDRRTAPLALTAAGLDALHAGNRRLDQLALEVLTDFDHEELEQLRRLLPRVAERVTAMLRGTG